MGENVELEARVRSLERQNRRLLWSVVGLAIAMAAATTFMLLRTPRVISAERFVLRDSGGGTRGEWAPSWELAGEIDGKEVRASITCLTLRDRNGFNGVRACTPWDEGRQSLVAVQHQSHSKAFLSASPFQATSRLEARRMGATKATSVLDSSVSHVGGWLSLREMERAMLVVKAEHVSLQDADGNELKGWPRSARPAAEESGE